jgi:hypothetical protein
MAPIVDEEPAQELAQFEPDPDGDGAVEQTAEGSGPDGPSDPQWVEWPDPEREAAWAAAELGQITPAKPR